MLKDKVNYKLDDRAIDFLQKINKDDLIQNKDSNFYLNIKDWNDKVYQVWMDVYRKQIADNNLCLETKSFIFFIFIPPIF